MVRQLDDVPILDWDEFDTSLPYEYHDVTTITLRELMESDVVTKAIFDDERIAWISETVRDRVWEKFCMRYEFREIGILPILKWMHRVTGRLSEVMPKYNPMYDAISRGQTYLVDGDEWHKGRDIHSEFPQTALGGSDVDYASRGLDTEHETIRYHDMLDYAGNILNYNDVDALILDELEPLFMCLMTQNINI